LLVIHLFKDSEQIKELLLSGIRPHGIDDVWQTETHTAELIVPELGSFEFESAMRKLKRHKSPGIDQILGELIQAGGKYIMF
jgi:hypothetical protein